MAKKKKRKKTYTPPQQAAGQAPKAAASVETPQAVRRERKDEVRREKERQLRAWKRREFARRALVGVLVVGGIAAVVVFVMRNSSGDQTSDTALQKLLDAYPAARTAAGCDEPTDVGPYQPVDQDHLHIGGDPVTTPPALTTYPTVPATSGPHNPSPITSGVYDQPQDIYQTLHSMEHGGAVIWYDPSLPESDLKPLQDFVKKNQDHVIMQPYGYPDQGSASKLPSGKVVALTSWHSLQTCKKVPGVPVVANFLAHYRYPTLGGLKFEGTNDPQLEKNAAM